MVPAFTNAPKTKHGCLRAGKMENGHLCIFLRTRRLLKKERKDKYKMSDIIFDVLLNANVKDVLLNTNVKHLHINSLSPKKPTFTPAFCSYLLIQSLDLQEHKHC